MENYNLKYQPNLTGMNINPQNGMPNSAMQGIEEMPQQIHEQVQDSYIGNRASQLAEINPLAQAAVSLPIWIGISQGMDLYAKKCRGEYDKTLQYKITNSGDVVVDKFKNSKFGKSKFFTSISSKVSKYARAFDQKLMARSYIYNSLRNIQTSPGFDMVKGQANGMRGIQLFDYPQVQNGFLESVKFAEDLDCYGADKNFIEQVKTKLDGVKGKAAKAQIIQDAEFDLLKKAGYTDAMAPNEAVFKNLPEKARAEVLQNMKAKASGYNDFAHWKSVEKNIQEHLPDVMEALSKSDNKMFVRRSWSDHNKFNTIKGQLLGRKVEFSEFRNKLLAELGDASKDPKLMQVLKNAGLDKNLPKSKLGRFMGKYVNLFMEGATNRVAGGKLVAMMQAFFLAEAAIRTAQAPKGDKISTFAERFMELIAFFACMPLAIKALHKIGGFKYLGMTKAEVKAYEDAVKVHNEKVKTGKYADKATCKTEIKRLKDMVKNGTKLKGKGPWITRPFRWLAKTAGKIVTVGLLQIRPYQKGSTTAGIGGKIKDIFKNPKYWTKELGGNFIRFALVLFAILPFISKIVVKATHKIFGKPEFSVLDEGKEDKNAPKENELTPEEMAKLTEIAKSMEAQQNAQNQEGNLLDKYRPQQQSANNNLQPQPQRIVQEAQPTRTYTYIPSPNGVKSESIEPSRGYIPTPTPPTNAMQDPSMGNDALAKSERAMQEAMRMLNI